MQLTGKIVPEHLKDFGKAELSASHRKIPRVWIVVADEYIAKIFKKNGQNLEFLGDASPMPIQSTLTNKSVGRVISSGMGSVHHKYEPHSGASRHQELFFTHQLAQWLDTAVNENAFDRLVLIAAPRTLGNLRKSLGKQVQARVVAELSKEMTKHTEAMLCRELSSVIL